MRFTDERRHDGTLERRFLLDGIPGILWTADAASAPAPLVLLGHPGGLAGMHDRLAARARALTTAGIAAATIELPGSGDRSAIPALDAARADLHRVLSTGRPVPDDLVDRLVLPLVERSAPEWRSALDALLELPGLGGPVGWSGGVLALSLRLAVEEDRIRAALFFAGSYVPQVMVEDEALRLTKPVLVLLQWDDEGNDRQRSLDLFDALASPQKTLHCNTGGHTGVPAFESDDATRFFLRHLR